MCIRDRRAGDRDLAVDPGEEVGRGADRLRDRDRVLEQPVAVGLVVDLGRRRVAEAGPLLRALAEEAVEQPAQLRLLHGAQKLTQFALELLEGDPVSYTHLTLPTILRV